MVPSTNVVDVASFWGGGFTKEQMDPKYGFGMYLTPEGKYPEYPKYPGYPSNAPKVDQGAVNEASRKQRSLSLTTKSSSTILTPDLSTMGAAPVAQKNLLGI